VRTKVIILSTLGLLLCGCTVGPSSGLASIAEARAQEGRQRIAQEAAQSAAELSARQTMYALEALGVQATMTADARISQATQQADATREAASSTATAQSNAATATAIGARATQEVFRQEIQGYVDVGWLLLPLCGSAAVIGIVIAFLWKGSDYLWEAYIRRQSIAEHRAGTIAWIEDDEGRMVPAIIGPMLTPPRIPQLSPRVTVNHGGGGDGVYKLTASGSVLASPVGRREPPENAGVRELALDLLWKAQHLYGVTGTTIPGWRQVDGFNSEKWQRVIASLRALGFVETSNAGTFLVGVTIGDLHYKIETNQVKVRPTPVNNFVSENV
jgi:hypothetical protein